MLGGCGSVGTLPMWGGPHTVLGGAFTGRGTGAQQGTMDDLHQKARDYIKQRTYAKHPLHVSWGFKCKMLQCLLVHCAGYRLVVKAPAMSVSRGSAVPQSANLPAEGPCGPKRTRNFAVKPRHCGICWTCIAGANEISFMSIEGHSRFMGCHGGLKCMFQVL